MFACIHLPGTPQGFSKTLQECAGRFAPEVELAGPATVLFDAGRIVRLYGSLEQIAQAVESHARSLGLHPNIALAPDAESAQIAARSYSGTSILLEDSAEGLAPLEIESLPITQELWELFDSWGIRTLRDLAQLPESAIAERLGQEGVYLHRLARGGAGRPLRIRKQEANFEERVELEHGLTELEPLLFILGRILNDQCEKLCSHGFGANEIRLTLQLEKRSRHERLIRLPLPMRDSKAMLKLLQLDLEAHRPQAAIVAVHLALAPAQPRTTQGGMFLPLAPAPDKLEITLARIRALVGEGNAGVPELLNTHRPAPFTLAVRQPAVGSDTSQLRVRLAFRYFQPPLEARVVCSEDRPIRLSAGLIRGNVQTCAGPWRASGGWWTEESWDREEWDISLNDGAIYRIYKDASDEWFVEGAYD